MNLQPSSLAAVTVVALDVGHSAVKVAYRSGSDTGAFLFESYVCRAMAITDPNTARLARLDTVTSSDAVDYFFGDTARNQSRAATHSGMTSNWIESQIHEVLVRGAIKKLSLRSPSVSVEGAFIVAGLPSQNFLKDHKQYEATLRRIIPGAASILVLPQPLGPFFLMNYSSDGRAVARSGKHDQWAIVEVGHYTTDYALVAGGAWVQHGTNSSPGASLAAKELSGLITDHFGFPCSVSDAATYLPTGQITVFDEVKDISALVSQVKANFADGVLAMAQQLFGDVAHQLKGIVVAGGGAPLVIDALRNLNPNVVYAPEESRFSVAQGFLRAGIRSFVTSEARRASPDLQTHHQPA